MSPERLNLAHDEAYCGLILREAGLDQVIHFFIYAADHYADVYLGGDQG